MKIIYYSPHPHLSTKDNAGYATHINEMIYAFKELGHVVYPIIMGDFFSKKSEAGFLNETENIKKSKAKLLIKPLVPNIIWQSVRDISILLFDRKAKKELKKSIHQVHPDMVYERGAYLQVKGLKLTKDYKISHVLEMNSPCVEERKDLSGRSLLHCLGEKFEKKQLVLTDKIAVVSSTLRDYFIRQHQINKGKFVITPNAINLKSVNTHQDILDEIQRKYKLNSDIVIGFVGSIFPWHGVDILIESFLQLSLEYNNIRLMIVGDGFVLQEYKKRYKTHSNYDRIIFTGSIAHTHVFNYIKIMNICVLAKSNWYGSPIKLFEYGAMGKAIIAPDNGPMNDVMQNKADGLLIKNSKQDLYKAIHYYLKNFEMVTTHGKAFKNKTQSKYTWNENANRILNVLNY